MNSWIRITVCLLSAALFAACQTGRTNEPQWRSTTASAPSESVIWEVALQGLLKPLEALLTFVSAF